MAEAMPNKHPSDLAADKAAALALTPVSRETEARLIAMSICCWNGRPRPIWSRRRRLPNLWTRHISDSLQLLSLAPSAKIWADLGSGGGFPGRGAGLRAGGDAGAMVHLVERNAKKAAFLREALRVTGLAGHSSPG